MAMKRHGSLTIRWQIGDALHSPPYWFEPEMSLAAIQAGKPGQTEWLRSKAAWR
jgi:hypothetical protein